MIAIPIFNSKYIHFILILAGKLWTKVGIFFTITLIYLITIHHLYPPVLLNEQFIAQTRIFPVNEPYEVFVQLSPHAHLERFQEDLVGLHGCSIVHVVDDGNVALGQLKIDYLILELQIVLVEGLLGNFFIGAADVDVSKLCTLGVGLTYFNFFHCIGFLVFLIYF